MRVLGIDPGLATVGYAIINVVDGVVELEDYGIISTPSNLPKTKRLRMLYSDMLQLLHQAKPDTLAMEKYFSAGNGANSTDVGNACGVILLALETMDMEVPEYSPSTVKASVAGSGRAKKHEVRTAVMEELALKNLPGPDDGIDAIAIALTHIWAIQC